MNDRPDLVCGIDREIIEEFLILIRDRYEPASEATYFLETYIGVSSLTTAITNQRDVLSHLSTILRRPDLSKDDMKYHIAEAGAHFHRSIFETYETAADIMFQRFFKVYRRYKLWVLIGRMGRMPASAPNRIAIEARVKEIGRLRINARSAKGKNSWDANTLSAIEDGVRAVHMLKDLIAELEHHLQSAWFAGAVAFQVGLAILLLIIGYLLSK